MKKIFLLLCISLIGIFIFHGCKKEETPETKYIKITYPNGNDTIRTGTPITIKWEDNIDDYVFIQILRGNTMIELLTRGTASNGEFVWLPGGSLAIDTSYKIKITSVYDSNIQDQSDKSFTILRPIITNVPYIKVLSPNGGEELSEQVYTNISWERNFTGLVKILLIRNGTVLGEISGNGTTANSMDVGFGNAFPYGSGYKIRVCDAANYSLYDDSDSDFSLTP